MPSIIENGFSVAELVNGINAAKVSSGPIGRLKVFTPQPIKSAKLIVESVGDALTLVPASLRGAPSDPHSTAKRSQVPFVVPRYATRDTILAASIQDVTGYGTPGVAANPSTERDRRLAEMRARLEATLEYVRARALAGSILDADGSVLIDLHAELGVAPNIVDFDLANPAVKVAQKVVAALRASEAELGANLPSGYVAFASPSFMDALHGHPSYETALAGWNAASILTADYRPGTVVLSGVPFVECPSIAGRACIDEGKAFMVPMGVAGLLGQFHAPDDSMSGANEFGALPFTARGEALPFDKGIALEAQANAIAIVARPRCVVELTA